MNDRVASEPSYSEERLLLREMAHRVHNEFASAMAAVSVTASRSGNDEVKATLAAVRERLYRYAQVHRALEVPTQACIVEASSHLRQLCDAISRSKLDQRGIALDFIAAPFLLHSERCWRLGMIVSELITNAARHAFKERAGKIFVELTVSGCFVECRVSDNGAGAAHVRPGQGLKIIAALTEGLDGRITQHFGPEGSRSIVSFQADVGSDEAAPSAVALRSEHGVHQAARA